MMKRILALVLVLVAMVALGTQYERMFMPLLLKPRRARMEIALPPLRTAVPAFPPPATGTAEIVMPTLPPATMTAEIAMPTPALALLEVVNGERQQRGLAALKVDARLMTAAALIAGDGGECPFEAQNPEVLIGQALDHVGYQEARGYVLIACGEYSVAELAELTNASRIDELVDAGQAHVPGPTEVWVLVAGRPRE